MAFKMKSFNQLLSLHPSSNKLDNVIKLVDMPSKKHWGYIDENKTIHVNKNLSPKNMSRTIAHENVHKQQMSLKGKSHEPRLQFNSLFYKWEGGRKEKSITIPTKSIDTKSRKLPWEIEAEKAG